MWLCVSLLLSRSFPTNANKTTKYELSVSCSSHTADTLYSHWCRKGASARPPGIVSFQWGANQRSVNDFIDCGLLVPRAGDDELVIRWDVAAENWRRLLWLCGETNRKEPLQTTRFKEKLKLSGLLNQIYCVPCENKTDSTWNMLDP